MTNSVKHEIEVIITKNKSQPKLLAITPEITGKITHNNPTAELNNANIVAA